MTPAYLQSNHTDWPLNHWVLDCSTQTWSSACWRHSTFFSNALLKTIYLFLSVRVPCCCVGFSLVVVRGLLSGCDAWASHCSGFSCCRAWALGTWVSVVAAHGFSSCGSWTLQHRLNSCGKGISCSVACGIFLDSGLNPCLLHWQADSIATVPPGKPNNVLSDSITSWAHPSRPITSHTSHIQLPSTADKFYNSAFPSTLCYDRLLVIPHSSFFPFLSY